VKNITVIAYVGGYLVICRTILRIMSKPGLSSGTSFQHLWMSSDNGSGQSCPDMSGRKYGSSRFPTRSKISKFKINISEYCCFRCTFVFSWNPQVSWNVSTPNFHLSKRRQKRKKNSNCISFKLGKIDVYIFSYLLQE